MTLSTHMATGAAASRIFASHPVQAFFIGWFSHYIFDSIAHWDYPLQAFDADEKTSLNTKINLNKYLMLDASKVLLDLLLGCLIVWAFASFSFFGIFTLIFVGALGACMPDFMQFVYGLSKVEPLTTLQKFHNFMHAKKKLNDKPLLGIGYQALIITLASLSLFV